ncbi:MAG: ABC transporter ATP-binding protein [Lachnospiraceae bacterium]
MKRLMSYLKPHKFAMAVSLILVSLVIVFELYQPIIIGDAIDNYINGYYSPYGVVGKDEKTAVAYEGNYISKEFNTKGAKEFYQIYLFQEEYYMFHLTEEKECTQLREKTSGEKMQDGSLIVDLNGQKEVGEPLTKNELRTLRKFDFAGIVQSAIRYLLVLIAAFVCNLVEIWTLQKMGQGIIYRMREQVFSHIHSLSLNFFNTEPVGKLVTRVSNDTESVNELFTSVLVKVFKNIIKIFGFAAVMFSINVKLTLYSFAMLPLVAALTFFFRYLSRVAYRAVRTRLTDLNTFLSENISGMKLIQIFTREEQKYDEFKGKSQNLYRAYFREVMTFAIFRPSIYILSVVALVVIIGFGGKLTLAGTISLGTLFVFINYIRSFFEPIQELAEQFGALQSSLASAEKIFTILDETPTVPKAVHPRTIEKLEGEIEFKHVWFAYEGEDYILKDVSFKIRKGERIAFVGATGAGKTSILNLIGHYFDIQKGEILIDGINIKDISTDVLRASIGQVQQDVFIFTGDIKSNISLRNDKISQEEIETAARYVNADKFISKLPQKYNEPVTERGSTLSAGQRQLLSFARTLAYKPNILVLDEATANIDTETEHLITQALERLMEGRTTIMVAHRLSTIQHANMIMVMDKGEIKESGTHQQLISRDGIYRKLYELQLTQQQ